MKAFITQRLLMIPAAAVMAALVWGLGLPILHWLRLWLPVPAWLFALIWLTPAISLTLSYVLTDRRLRSWLHRLGESWLGLFLYLTMAFWLEAIILWALSLLGVEVSGVWRLRGGWLALAAFALCYIGGLLNALLLRVERYTVSLPLARPLDLALVSDLHLGFFTGPGMLVRVKNAVLGLSPDAVLLAGDIFDMEYDGLRQPQRHREALSEISRSVPVYACGGNHDLLFPDPRKDAFIRDSGIKLLADESVDMDGLTLLGRRDALDELRESPDRVYSGLTGDKPLVVLDHNPSGYREAWEHGARLVLSGHSHGGQTFPGNLLQRLFMPYPIYGHHQEGERHLVVTSGAGFWGPPLRLGVNNEVVLLHLAPEAETDGRAAAAAESGG